jgi:hypothetical protein
MEVLYTYVLQLKQGKWYVGKTNDPFNRLMQHVHENGSAWSRKYAPLQVHEVKPHASRFDEDNKTLEYMETYGIDNVRGGCYVQVVLPAEQRREIQRKIASVKDACFNCGESGHTVANCPNDVEEEEEAGCSRCGRDTHDASKCYAKTHLDGGELREARPKKSKSKPKKQREPSPVVCGRCGRGNHDESTCYAKTLAPGFSPPKQSRKKGKQKKQNADEACFRCGRPGHWEGDCYAKTDFEGRPI